MTTPLRLPDAFTQGRTRAAAATPTCCCCCCCCAISAAATSVALPLGFLADTAGTTGGPPGRTRSARTFAAAMLALVPAAVILSAFVLAQAAGGIALVLSIVGGLVAVGVIGAFGGSETSANGTMRYLVGLLAVMAELAVGLHLIGLLVQFPEPLGVLIYLGVAGAVAVGIGRIYLRKLRR